MLPLLKRIGLLLASLLLLLAGVLVVAVLVLVRPYRLANIHIDSGAVSSQPGTYRAELVHDGLRRTYILHVPPLAGRVSDGQALPLVIALHGSGGTGANADDLMKLTPVADREGFLVAFPDGINKNWNDGRSDARREDQSVDDVGFIRAMIDEIAARLPVDAKRVYATGISNGGFMSNRLACEAADKIAAIGIVDATAAAGFQANCKPPRPVPVISFNGSADPLVPFNGGQVGFHFIKLGRVVSAEDLKSFWVQYDGCAPLRTTRPIPDIDTHDGSHAIEEAFGGCRENAAVDFYEVVGGGHTWPGGKQYLSPLLVGKTNHDINASELIWQFFASHPMPPVD